MTSRIAPQDGASGLVDHPHRFTFSGDAASLRFPPLCPNCGSAATTTVGYAKVFRRTDSESPTEHVVASVEVPCCGDCARRHGAQAQEPTTFAKVLSSFATGDMLGAVFPAMLGAFFAYVALKDLVRGQWVRGAITFAFASFLGLIAWFQRRHVWAATRHLRVPPQTDVARAFDFSDDVADAFEPPRFICTVRDPRFAEVLASLNADRAWVAGSPQARAERRAANRQMWVIGGIVAALAVAGWIVEWFR